MTSLPPIYVLDLETDPFLRDRIPMPFAGGLYDGNQFAYSWGGDCIDKLYERLSQLPIGIVYIHNGGKFDLFYLMEKLRGRMLVINGRIVKATAENGHEFRDSYAIMPIPLAGYKKDEIDYAKMEVDVRELHKAEILDYLKSDCKYLYELVTEFIARFGIQITIGSTSMKEFRKLHDFTKLYPREDRSIRGGLTEDGSYVPGFYFGGRVQCFQRGNLFGAFKIYDVNSMYPYAMRNYSHPIGAPSSTTTKITPDTCFIEAEGKNYGAFAVRTKTGLDFTKEKGRFYTTIHEWQAAIDCGLFVPTRVFRCVNFIRRDSFATFVDQFYNSRLQAKAAGDTFGSIFYKLVLNSSYGKLAANPEDYCDYEISDVDLRPDGWQMETIVHGKWGIYYKPSERLPNYFNVAAGASVTGAARAILMEAIHKAVNPVYCDTDSLICESLSDTRMGDTELGAWKLEAEGTRVAIAGKKMYAVWDGDTVIKQANKGVDITADEIARVCDGEQIKCYKDSPTFSLKRHPVFQSRTVKMTGDNLVTM